MKGSSLTSIILVGGFGTRLRPLTLNCPKAILPILNRPFLSYQLDILKEAGVRDVVLAAGHHARHLVNSIKCIRPAGMKIHFALEPKPLGTAGAIRFAYDVLKKKVGKLGPVSVFNGDVLFDLPLTKFLRFHQKNRAACSIALIPVGDPSRFGVVETKSSHQVSRFIEKPQNYRKAAFVNAGAYLFEPSFLEKIPSGKTLSIERDIYPRFLRKGEPIFGFRMSGYWNDIGTPQTYLQAHFDLLTGNNLFTPKSNLRKRDHFLIGRNSSIARDVRLEGSVCVGNNVRIASGSSIKNSVVLDGARIDEGAEISGSIVGFGARVGKACVLREGSVIGDKTILSSFTRC